jgi:hypothetical protein
LLKTWFFSPLQRAHMAGMASRTEPDAPGGCARVFVSLYRDSLGPIAFSPSPREKSTGVATTGRKPRR